MNEHMAQRLHAEYDHLFHDSMKALPNGWIKPLGHLLDRMQALSDIGPRAFTGTGVAPVTWVQIRVEVYQSSAMVFATPIMPSGNWNPERALACVEAMNDFHDETQETCTVCGRDGQLRMWALGDRREGVLCDEHADGVDHEA
jgi:hypothetical protein